MSSKLSMDVLFPAASAEKVLCLMEKMRKKEPPERTIVDNAGSKNAISHLRGQDIGKATHNNLLDVVELPMHS